jgi:PTS system ascorbate-specific IIA component
MSIGLLLIAHGHIGDELLTSAQDILGPCPLPSRTLSVFPSDDLETICASAHELLAQLPCPGGVLVMTDLYGSTPSNVAAQMDTHDRVQVVAGLNLPMLIKVLGHHQKSLSELAELAIEAGREGILRCHAKPDYPVTLCATKGRG